MLSDVNERALAAAVEAATRHGLASDKAVVIYSGSNVMVHLRPAPVIARVMTGTVVLHNDPANWLAREVSVLRFLAPSGLAVAPSPFIAPGPYQQHSLWMTFTQRIPGAGPTTDRVGAIRLGQALRALHDALRPFGGDLGTLGDLRDDIERLLGYLQPAHAGEVDVISSLRARLEAIGEVVFASTLPVQALHGDVSLRNLLHTRERLVWNDFEDTFRGPVHWDLASYVTSLRLHGANSRFVRAMLDSYGWDDEQELAPFITAQAVYDEIWHLYDRQRRRGNLGSAAR